MENKTGEQEIIWAGLFSCGAGRMASSELQAQAGRQGLGKTARLLEAVSSTGHSSSPAEFTNPSLEATLLPAKPSPAQSGHKG